jgi:putative flippase GtrA
MLQELIVSIVLVVLLSLCANPFGLWMPDAVVTMIIVGLVVAFGIFSSFIWRETAADERESLHRMLAGRLAFLVGAGVLLLGIIVQSLNHNVDSWLVYSLVAMIFAKTGGFIYSRRKY